jgi:hypothetical protein
MMHRYVKDEDKGWYEKYSASYPQDGAQDSNY